MKTKKTEKEKFEKALREYLGWDDKTKEKEINEEDEKMLNDILDFPLEEPVELIKVIWKDANTINGTSSYEDIKERGLVTAHTIGYLVYKNDDSIAVCGFVFPDRYSEMIGENKMTAFRDVHIIPKRLITDVLILNVDYDKSREFRK